MATPGNAKRQRLTPAQWEQADRLFHEALDVPEQERAAWVESACAGDADVAAEVLSLLGSDASGGRELIAGQLAPAVQTLLRAPSAPARVGPYRLVREIGQGGMGTVYLAERDDDQYKTQVAVKLVRRGFDTDLILNRFFRERQTLARLQHPNIARLLDGGTTPDGMPYIVMEYIDGARITEYCRERGLSIAGRLTLFLDVCKAVDYAHRQFVVHRDLKPGNILVDQSGAVKLLDFGICKLLHAQPQQYGSGEETIEAGPGMLTPDYASPEQILGEPITVASDVYSAAAVLYELLTGTKPHRIESQTLSGIERGICEAEIVRPSLAVADRNVARQLRGDLDTILLYALQKDPARRYRTIEEFAADIRNHLAHKPVIARPDTFSYRAGKFLRRRRGFVAAAAAVLIATGAGVGASWRSARIANENLRLVRQLSNTFVFDVYDSVADLPGSTKARQLIVSTGLQYLDNLSRNASGDVELQRELAAAYRRIGDVQGHAKSSNLGNTAAALASYQKAVALLDSVVRADPGNREAILEQITVHQHIGTVQSYTKHYSEVLKTQADARARVEAHLARFPGDYELSRRLADLYNATSEVQRRINDYASAKVSSENGLRILTAFEQTHPDDLDLQQAISIAYSGIATCNARLGRLQEAVEGHRQALARMERVAPQKPNNTGIQRDLMFKYSHLGDVLGNPNLSNVGDREGAVAAYRKMAEVARRLHEADPADLRATGDYAIAMLRVGGVSSDARTQAGIFRQSLQLMRQVETADPDNFIIRVEISAACNFLGDALLASGEPGPAAVAFREGLRTGETVLGSGSATAVAAYLLMTRKLGVLTVRQGNRAEAQELVRKALALADPKNPTVLKWPSQLQTVGRHRANGAAGITLAALAATASKGSPERAAALARLRLSLEGFREMEQKSGFNALRRQEMRHVEEAMESLR